MKRLMEDGGKGATIAAYPVVPGTCTAEDTARLEAKATPIGGSDQRAAVNETSLHTNGAYVTKHNITADNGVIHAIDQPPVPIDDLAASTAELSSILAAPVKVLVRVQYDEE